MNTHMKKGHLYFISPDGHDCSLAHLTLCPLSEIHPHDTKFIPKQTNGKMDINTQEVVP